MKAKGVSAPLIVSLVGTVLMAVLSLIATAGDYDWSKPQLWIMVVISAIGAFNVWAAANLPGYENIKKYVAAATLVLQALFVFVIGGVSTGEWINLAITLLTALGVAVVPHPITTTQNTGTVPGVAAGGNAPAVGGTPVTVVKPA
jgi:hypothetical protein